MYKLVIKGGTPLSGSIKTSGSKNATLPIFFSSILADEPLKLSNTPQLSDVSTTLRLLMDMGSNFVLEENGSIFIDSSTLTNLTAEYSLVKTMRASILTLGPMLAKYKKAKISLPGGCAIGTRPVNLHLDALEKMGAKFISSNGKKLPITVVGARFKGFTLPITYKTLVASAQVKSAILLAALTARGVTTVKEPFQSRTNTESMLLERGAEVNSKTIKSGVNIVKIKGASYLQSTQISVPGDPSSAVFLTVAALITKNSNIIIKNILNDNMRLRVFKVLIKMGGKISFIKKTKKTLDVRVKYSNLNNVSIPAEDSTALIDEFPILSIAAACGKGKMSMEGLGELRYKESNRFLAIEVGLKKCGVNIKAIKNNLEIIGQKSVLGGCEIDSKNDHRIAMAFNILNLVSEKPINILGNNSIVTSFPSFFDIFKKLGVSIKPYD